MGLTLSGLPTQTSAVCDYSAGKFEKPSGATEGTFKQTSIQPIIGDSQTRQTRVMEADKIEIGDLKYSWDFGSNSASGQHAFKGLKAGTSKSLKATVSVTCEKITTHLTRTDFRTRTPGVPGTADKPGTPPGPWGDWTEGPVSSARPSIQLVNATPSSRTYSLTVITKPANFFWGDGVASEQTIQASNALTADKWNELVSRTEQRIDWEEQENIANYSSAEVSSNELITAEKYNIIANALNTSTVVGGKDGTLITASIFIALQTAVNK